MVALIGGVAFADEAGGTDRSDEGVRRAATVEIQPPTAPGLPERVQDQYEDKLGGAENVVAIPRSQADLPPVQQQAFERLIPQLQAIAAAQPGALNVEVVIVQVTLTLPDAGFVSFNWADGEFLFNTRTGNFDSYAATRGAFAGQVQAMAGTYRLDKSSPYSDNATAPGPNELAFVSVKAETPPRGGSSSGCSTLTLGAMVLFLLPLAFAKRGKK